MDAKKAYANILYRFICDQCDYKCSKKSSWNQHILTSKHQNANKKLKNANKIFFCDFCNINFKHQSSFCRHKKKCQIISLENEVELNNNIEDESKKNLERIISCFAKETIIEKLPIL